MLIDTISSCTIFICNLGEILGPIVAGLLSQYFGFSLGFAFMAAGILAFLVVYFVVAFRRRTGKKITTQLGFSLIGYK